MLIVNWICNIFRPKYLAIIWADEECAKILCWDGYVKEKNFFFFFQARNWARNTYQIACRYGVYKRVDGEPILVEGRYRNYYNVPIAPGYWRVDRRWETFCKKERESDDNIKVKDDE